MGTMCLIHPAPLWLLLCVCVSDIERERSWTVKRERKTRPFVWPFTALPNQCHTSTTSAQSFCRTAPKHRAPIICSFTLKREPFVCRCCPHPLSLSLGWFHWCTSLLLMCYFFSSRCWTDLYRGDTLCGWKVEQQDPVAGNTSLNHFEMSFRCAACS